MHIFFDPAIPHPYIYFTNILPDMHNDIQKYSDAEWFIWEKEWNQPKHLLAENQLKKSPIWRNTVHLLQRRAHSVCVCFPLSLFRCGMIFKWSRKNARHGMPCVHYTTTCVGRKSNAMPIYLQMQEICPEEHRINCNSGYLGKGTR